MTDQERLEKIYDLVLDLHSRSCVNNCRLDVLEKKADRKLSDWSLLFGMMVAVTILADFIKKL